MKSVMDTIMLIAFVLFMVWIIRGYHANKYEERYGKSDTEADKKDEGHKR
ncbi:hypothetical protein [Hydrogenimonas urashimensis]|nr:hypothetical protein [Hydrogenimonas urashimensis]